MEQNQTTGRPCRFCPTILRWIQSPIGGRIPCEEPAFIFHATGDSYHTEQLVNGELHLHPIVGQIPKGTYYTEAGRRYREHEVPKGVRLWREHWSNCPGAKEVRKPKEKKRPQRRR